ncbi:hypothetical protein [Epilithonimonas sp. UC225_85]|uniref:hypothetical protein n=1 Tax=Epilithonimonas sp. UC225_85 TaxID=3350167 RepID=UPI0036D3F629
MDQNYIKGTENWIEQAKNRLLQSEKNKEYLETKIKLEQQELKLVIEDIEHSKHWLKKTETELEEYKLIK